MSAHRVRLLLAVSFGGGLGALARYAVSLTAGPSTGWPWATFLANALGCLLVGVLMASLEHIARPHPALRAALGPGFLGGFTTFSAYAVDVVALMEDERGLLALAYLAGTAFVAIGAALLGWMLTGKALESRGLAPGGAG